jgi:hypothetical protein
MFQRSVNIFVPKDILKQDFSKQYRKVDSNLNVASYYL